MSCWLSLCYPDDWEHVVCSLVIGLRYVFDWGSKICWFFIVRKGAFYLFCLFFQSSRLALGIRNNIKFTASNS